MTRMYTIYSDYFVLNHTDTIIELVSMGDNLKLQVIDALLSPEVI